MFKQLIPVYINTYINLGSEIEKTDIRKAYLNGKGCINYMMESVPFMAVEDEPRIVELVKGWIAAEEVPEYKLFTEEPKAKRNRRHKKYAREALEARELKKEMEKKNSGANSLEQQIMKRNAERNATANNFFDHLMQKYGGVDDSEEYVSPMKKGKKTKKTSQKDTNGSEHPIRKGRVEKRKSSR